jgi:hypothetical protein
LRNIPDAANAWSTSSRTASLILERQGLLAFNELDCGDQFAERIERHLRATGWPTPVKEILAGLLRGFWLGDFDEDLTAQGRVGLRLALLRILSRMRDKAEGLMIFDPADQVEPSLRALPDGGVEIDPRPEIRLARDDAAWSAATISESCAAIARGVHAARRDDPLSLFPDAFVPALLAIPLTKTALTRWCAEESYLAPGFGAGLGYSASDQQIETSTAGAAPGKRNSRAAGGRPPKWDWEGCAIAMIAYANTPDGLPIGPSSQAKIERLMADWFQERYGEEPAESSIREHAAKIVLALGEGGGPPEAGNSLR